MLCIFSYSCQQIIYENNYGPRKKTINKKIFSINKKNNNGNYCVLKINNIFLDKWVFFEGKCMLP